MSRDCRGGQKAIQSNDIGTDEHGRPYLIELQECDHPLYRDQHDGISWHRAIEIARMIMHGEQTRS